MRKFIILSLFLSTISCIIYSCQNASEIELITYINNGKDIYQAKCQNCHGANGEGLGQLAPPLTDTVYLKINKSKIACVIKNGANESIVVHGKTYEGKMPAFPEMKAIDIAQVVVYITNSFGNKQGAYNHLLVENDLRNCK